MKNVERQLELLGRFGVECVIIEGIAGTVHGSSIPTSDLDVCYSRQPENLERLAPALKSVNARLRGAPPQIPFILDAETLRKGLNFTFESDIGSLDLLGEVRGVGWYSEAMEGAKLVDLAGYQFGVLSLPKLIASKRAAGRPKDLAALLDLEAIYEYQQSLKPDKES